ncbi:hypothetical protein C8R44DRAFT_985596 [Mycena epipterygia]|nr:hypothetical protein C8R44DRAFT_985596 [Mycena epipterygia]
MLWAAILLFCSVAATGNNTAGAVNTTAFTASIGGNIGNICAVQDATENSRILWQEFPSNNIMQLIVAGPFATTSTSSTLVVSLASANVLGGTPLACFIVGDYALQGYYDLSPNYTFSELYFDGVVHWGTGSACPDCIQNDGFIASRNTIGMYGMATANGGRYRRGGQSIYRAAICLGKTPTDGVNTIP